MSIDVNPVQEPIIEENTKIQNAIAYTRAFLRGPDAGWESGTAHIKAQVYDTLIVELANIKDELADQRIISDNWKARAECAQREIDSLKEQEPVAWVDVVDRYEGPYNFEGLELIAKGKHRLYRAAGAQPVQELHKPMNPTDIKIEVLYDGGGFSPISDKGVRITYIPTGCVFESISERSQHANREKAFQELTQYFGIKDSTYQEKN